MNQDFNWVIRECSKDNFLPDAEGVYIFKSNDLVLYVGQSQNIFVRMASHKNFINHLFSIYDNITVSYALVKDSRKHEAALIFNLKPIFNGKFAKKNLSLQKVVNDVRLAIDGRRIKWVADRTNIKYQLLTRKINGKLPFYQEDIDAINNLLNTSISLNG